VILFLVRSGTLGNETGRKSGTASEIVSNPYYKTSLYIIIKTIYFCGFTGTGE